MQRGTVRDEDGNEYQGELRPNGTVTFSAGRVTKYADLTSFPDLGFTWTAQSESTVPRGEDAPVDTRLVRITGDGL